MTKILRAGRPRSQRCVRLRSKSKLFKPQGIPARFLDFVELTKEEVEALRLKNIEGMEQTACAVKMKTSQSTFQRILASSYKKISEALVRGKGIKIIDE